MATSSSREASAPAPRPAPGARRRTLLLAIAIGLVPLLALLALTHRFLDGRAAREPEGAVAAPPAGPEPERAASAPETLAAPAREPARGATPARGTSATEIEVLDERSSAPITGALLSFTVRGTSLSLGRTDGSGELRVPLPIAHGAEGWILAQAERHASEQVHLSEPNPPRVRIRLRRAAEVRGRVLDASRAPAGAGFLVVAWPLTQPLREAADLQGVMRGSRSGSWARTEADGSFVLGGLAEGVPHGIDAGGAGLLTAKPAYAVPGAPGAPEAEGVELVVMPVLGSILAPRTSSGEPLEISPSHVLGMFTSIPVHGLQRLRGPGSEARLALAGVLLEELEPLAPTDEPYLAVWEDPRVDPIVKFSACYPGYRFVSGEAELRPVAGGVPVHPIPLSPDAVGTGTLCVELTGVPEALHPCPGRTSAEVSIVSMAAEGEPAEHLLSIDDLTRSLCAEVPAGSYRVSILATGAGRDLAIGEPRDRTVAVERGGRAVASFDLGGAGSFRVRAWTASGEEHTGRLNLLTSRLEEGVPRRKADRVFSTAPYRVVGMPPGVYRVSVSWPRPPGSPAEAEAVDVEVFPGVESELELTVP